MPPVLLCRVEDLPRLLEAVEALIEAAGLEAAGLEEAGLEEAEAA